MFRLLITVALVYAATAMTTDHPNNGCCTANKFSATLLELGANLQHNNTEPEFRLGYVDIDFDYDLQQSKLDSFMVNQATGNYDHATVYNDYPNSKTYTVSDGHCYVSHITATGRSAMTPPCIPSNFTFERSYRLGDVSAPLMVDVFQGMALGERMDLHIQSDDCTPILESFYGERTLLQDLDVTSFMFANVQQHTLRSANPFDLPDLCKSGPEAIGK